MDGGKLRPKAFMEKQIISDRDRNQYYCDVRKSSRTWLGRPQSWSTQSRIASRKKDMGDIVSSMNSQRQLQPIILQSDKS